HCDNTVFLVRFREHHTHGVASLRRNLVDARPNDLTLLHDDENLFAVLDDESSHQVSALLGDLGNPDSQTAAALQAVFVDGGALGVAGLGDNEDVGVGLDDVHRQQLVVALELHTGDASGDPAQRSDRLVIGSEADRHALARDHQQVIIGADDPGRDELVGLPLVLAQVDGDDTAGAIRVVFAQAGLLHHTGAGGEDEELRFLVVADGQHLRDRLAGLECEQVRHVLTLRIARALRQLVGLGAVDATGVREEQQPIVGGGDEELLDDVVAAKRGALDPLAAAVLSTVEARLRPLRIAAAGDRDDDLLLGDEVLHRHVPVETGEDLRPTVVTVAFDDLVELLGHDLPLPGGRGQDVVVFGDEGLDLLGLLLDLQTLQGREPAQLEIEDRIRLDLVDLEQLHQTGPSLVRGRGPADQGDDLVEGIEGLEVAAQDVGALLGLAQSVLGAPDDDLDLVLDPQAQEGVDAQRARDAVDEREHVRGEVLLQRGVLVEVVEHDLGHRIAFEHDDQSLTGPARGLVAQIRDARDLAVLDIGGDLRGQGVGVDEVGQLGHDQAGPALDLLDLDDGALSDRAAPG